MRDTLLGRAQTQPDPRDTPRTPCLKIYVSSHCANCSEARRLAELAAVRYPCVTVQVVDLDAEQTPLPEFIVAVPTYVFEGRVIWLGNPSSGELLARLGEAVG
ncbi:MAG: thioredoxin family protein [Chloroflexota bacterium]|nr:thioredoxin family protein [Chloroflexota bacterium]